MSNSLTITNNPGALVVTKAKEVYRRHKDKLVLKDGKFPDLKFSNSLIPVEDCNLIIEHLKQIDFPAGECDSTSETCRIIANAFPQSTEGMASPETYQALLIELFSEYPEAVHAKARRQVVRNCKFRPSIAEVKEILDGLHGKWKLSSKIAEKHLIEADRREKETLRIEQVKKDQESRPQFIEKMREKYGDEAVNHAQQFMGEDTKPFMKSKMPEQTETYEQHMHRIRQELQPNGPETSEREAAE